MKVIIDRFEGEYAVVESILVSILKKLKKGKKILLS